MAVCGDRVVTEGRETCDDGNTESGDGCSSSCYAETAVDVYWPISNLAGEPQPCPAGFDLAEIVEEGVLLPTVIHPFPCEARQATLPFLLHPHPKAQARRMSLRFARSDTHEVLTTLPPASIRLASTPIDVTFPLVTDAGWVSIHWTLAQPCAARGVSILHIDAIPASGPTITKAVPCADMGWATTELLPVGRYRIAVIAPSASGIGTGMSEDVDVPSFSRTVYPAPIAVRF